MLRGELTNLRAVERGDAAVLYRWLNDPDVMRYWGAPDSTVSVVEIQRRIEDWLDQEAHAGRPAALIAETLDGESIGLIVLSQAQGVARSVEVSLMIGERRLWGQGYGTDLLRTVVETCFDAWNLHRVWVRSEASNARAHRLYAKLGFHREATLRDAAFMDGHYEDVVVFGLLESDET